MKTGRGAGYSIWLMPTGELRTAFGRTIRALSAAYGTPVFPPHVTLLGHIPLNAPDPAATLRDLARRLAPFDIELGRADHGDEYFRCVFVRVKPSRALGAAHRKSRLAFGVTPPARYFPHLSLVYGSLDEQTRRRLVRTLGTLKVAFTVTRLHLYLTDGPVESWRPVGSATLAGPQASDY